MSNTTINNAVLDILGNLTGVNANVTTLTATGQINATGNVVLSPGKSVFASQMPFFWSSPIHGNPATGANLIVTGAMADFKRDIQTYGGINQYI